MIGQLKVPVILAVCRLRYHAAAQRRTSPLMPATPNMPQRHEMRPSSQEAGLKEVGILNERRAHHEVQNFAGCVAAVVHEASTLAAKAQRAREKHACSVRRRP